MGVLLHGPLPGHQHAPAVELAEEPQRAVGQDHLLRRHLRGQQRQAQAAGGAQAGPGWGSPGLPSPAAPAPGPAPGPWRPAGSCRRW